MTRGPLIFRAVNDALGCRAAAICETKESRERKAKSRSNSDVEIVVGAEGAQQSGNASAAT
jgi:hypothetical protein